MSISDVLIERQVSLGTHGASSSRRTVGVPSRRRPALLSLLPGLLSIVDWCAIIAIGYGVNQWIALNGGAPAEIPALSLVLAATLMVNYTVILRGYAPQSASGRSLIAKGCMGWAGCIASLGLIYALIGRLEECFLAQPAQLWYTAGLTYVLLIRAIVGWQVTQWREQGRLLPTIAVLGADPAAVEFAARLQGAEGAHVVGLFMEGGGGSKSIPGIAGTTDDLVALAAANEVDHVILASPWPSSASLNSTLTRFGPLQTAVSIDAALQRFAIAPLDFRFVGSVPTVTVQRPPLSEWGAAAKRVEDIIISLLALTLLAPLLVVIAILVRIDSRGPIIFRQERFGSGNRRFFVLKFRTMQHEATPDPLVPQAKRSDPRVTPIGAVLRRFSLDELPQLFNVLRGDMSLVGPRPHAAAHNEKYARLIDGYLTRHRVKPGITGWAQVNGQRGGTDTPQQMQERLHYDLCYIANWSLYLDLKVLLLTVPVVICGINAY